MDVVSGTWSCFETPKSRPYETLEEAAKDIGRIVSNGSESLFMITGASMDFSNDTPKILILISNGSKYTTERAFELLLFYDTGKPVGFEEK